MTRPFRTGISHRLRGTIVVATKRGGRSRTVRPPDASREEIMNRRENLKCIAGAAALLSLSIGRTIAQTAPTGPFKRPPLGYASDALDPHIDARTMTIHHDRHPAAYVNNANQIAQSWAELGTMPIEKALANLAAVPENVRAGVRNN